jgi:ethanolamine permease
VALNIWGVEMTFHVSLVITLVALAVLMVFWAGAVPHFDLQRWAAPYFP